MGIVPQEADERLITRSFESSPNAVTGGEGAVGIEREQLWEHPVDAANWEEKLPIPAPPALVEKQRAALEAALEQDRRKVVVLDDDPTGSQTVHGVEVLTRWSREEFTRALTASGKMFFVLTNSRSLPEGQAIELNAGIAQELVQASRDTGVAFTLVSRSDSTLRGHFPAETDELARILRQAGSPVDAVVLVPFFEEGGRFTAWDVQWVRQGDRMIPVSETEFAQDHLFGYRSSNLRDWVEERTGGRIKAREVLSLSLDLLRSQPPERVADLLAAYQGPAIVVNATSYRDLEGAVAALLAAEARGKRYVYRTAASFLRVRGGISPRPLLGAHDLYQRGVPASREGRKGGGLVVVGSYVRRTGAQLARLLKQPEVVGIELRVQRILLSATSRQDEVDQASRTITEALERGRVAVLYTSRDVQTRPGEAGLQVGASIADALVEAVGRVEEAPRFVIAKGGVTSSRVATDALGVRCAFVLGPILPGVPVWRLGSETRFPGIPYVIFPGNVGDENGLVEAVRRLEG